MWVGRDGEASWEVAAPLGPRLGSSWLFVGGYDWGDCGFWELTVWRSSGCSKAGQGARGVGTARPLGAASRHTRATVPAAALGARPHLQALNQGLESARRAAQTCPSGRHRGVVDKTVGKSLCLGEYREEDRLRTDPGEAGKDLGRQRASKFKPARPSCCKTSSTVPLIF